MTRRFPTPLSLAAGAVLALCCALARPAAAQTLEGVLLERGSDQPIDLALLTLLTTEGDSVDATLTDAAGRFVLTSRRPGEFLLNGLALGYRGSTTGIFALGKGSSMSVEFRLEPQPVAIAGLSVEARASLVTQPKLVRNGFVQRVQSGFGRFLTPREIEDSDALTTAELLRRTGRVSIEESVRGAVVRMLGTGGYCSPRVYVDGVRVALAGAPLEAIVPLQVLEAVEVYRSGSEAPLQYGGTSGGCGVILLWTKSR